MTTVPEAPSPGAFGRYADWYDRFYPDKDYDAESAYVLNRIRALGEAPARWLDVGCGTGRHVSYLHARGLEVAGVDASPGMIDHARRLHPHLSFQVATAQTFESTTPQDVVSMLFHVMNYQTSDAMVDQAMTKAGMALRPGGIFTFDFWNSDGVRADPPGPRARAIEIGGRSLWRLSAPVGLSGNRIDVHYEFRWDSPDGPLEHEETHRLRHFSPGELELLLSHAGFRLLTCEAWMEERPLATDAWYGFICARRER